MHLCILNEKIEDFNCKLTGKKCGENMKFVPVNRRIIAILPLSRNPWRQVCVQQCRCAGKEYLKRCINIIPQAKETSLTKISSTKVVKFLKYLF